MLCPDESVVGPCSMGTADELKDTAPDIAKPAEPVVICDFCGPVKGPKAEVYQCQLCMKSFCIKHVDPFFHMCPSSRQS